MTHYDILILLLICIIMLQIIYNIGKQLICLILEPFNSASIDNILLWYDALFYNGNVLQRHKIIQEFNIFNFDSSLYTAIVTNTPFTA